MLELQDIANMEEKFVAIKTINWISIIFSNEIRNFKRPQYTFSYLDNNSENNSMKQIMGTFLGLE